MKRVVIFGAGSAVARAVTSLFARDGARLHLVARDQGALDEMRREFSAMGAGQMSIATADLAAVEGIPAVVAHAASALGGIDIALIAHGVLPATNALRDEPHALQSLFQVNAASPAALIEQLVTQAPRATVVVLGSVAADRARPANYAYGASKAALEAFVDGVRYRAESAGVAIVNVKLGFVHSPMTAGKPVPPFAARPDEVAAVIHRLAMHGKSTTAYVPGIWRWVMLVMQLLPRAIVGRMRG
jgi:decaprenylphospho-beta-D-erythro-pentofuranosid-2-ulose 2-reductase